MDYQHSSQANAGVNEPFSARQPPFRSTASKQARSHNGTPTRSRASPRSSAYEHSAVTARNDPLSLTPASGESGSLSTGGPGRQDVVMVDAKGNRLGFPYHTRYPPIRIVESGPLGTGGISIRNRAPASRPAMRDSGEGAVRDFQTGTMQPLALGASQTGSLVAATAALAALPDKAGKPRYSIAAPTPSLFWPSSLHLDLRQPLPVTTPYHLPNPLNQTMAAEGAYISPYPPLQQTFPARRPTLPTNQALANPPPTAAPSQNASHDVLPSTQSQASSASTLRRDPPNTHPLSASQLEELDLPALDADFDPLSTETGTDNAIDGSTINEIDRDWLSWDDFPADVDLDLDLDFEFTPVDGL